MATRRHFLSATAALIAASGLSPRRARAATGQDLKFIFVFNPGGWDITRVFASEFDNPNVDMERTAGESRVSELRFVAEPGRPSVSTFFERHAQKSMILNGILVPSVAHDNCTRLVMTGSTATTRADWPAILGVEAQSGQALPHLVIGGPSYPGDAGSAVTRTGSSGQFQGLLSGDILSWSEQQTSGPISRAEDLIDSYIKLRAGGAAASGEGRTRSLAEAYGQVLDRAGSLKGLSTVVDWTTDSSFGSQVKLAVDVLSKGVSRCATLQYYQYSWDTHTNNDLYQSINFEGLFAGLIDLMDRLAASPGSAPGASLADETVVVVLSEMARTPALNGADGKDHWPYTSQLWVGPGITGNRVVGGFDSYYYGQKIDYATGDTTESGDLLSADSVGASLLTLAGVDPSSWLEGVDPILGILS